MRFKHFILIILSLLIVSSCKTSIKTSIYDDVKIYDMPSIDGSKIIIPKNQSNGQSLSIIVISKTGEIVVFDGGRVEDADYLYEIIKKNGLNVHSWFLTHIHDDHIGALLHILTDEKYNDLKIKNIYYNFADFEWYYEKIKEDAGILLLFNEAIRKHKINIHNDIVRDDVYNISTVSVRVLNNLYKFDTDPINNSSIAYKVKVDECNMILFGDLGYKGGEALYYDINDYKDFRSDILVLSHHGQNGVPLALYTIIYPRIVVWPTSRDIYENLNGKYDTDATKQVLNDIKYDFDILTYECTSIIK